MRMPSRTSLLYSFNLTPYELVLEPVPHCCHNERQVVALTVLRAAFFRGENTQRFVRRSRRVEQRLRVRERNLLVFGAVDDQERAAHLLHHAIEAEGLELLQRLVERVDAEDPGNVMPGHRERRLEFDV